MFKSSFYFFELWFYNMKKVPSTKTICVNNQVILISQPKSHMYNCSSFPELRKKSTKLRLIVVAQVRPT